MAAPTGRTPNRQYPYPIPDDQVDVPRDVQALATALDYVTSGTLAARPAVGKPGATYYATDVQTLYFDVGTSWIPIGGPGVDNIPIGTIVAYAGANAPNAKWLICDLTPRSISAYPDLAALCAPYAQSPGTGNFNTPDLRGRMIIGAGTGNYSTPVTARAVGSRGGEERHKLAATESGIATHDHPLGTLALVSGGANGAHGHTITDPGHNHTASDSGHGHATSPIVDGGGGYHFAGGSLGNFMSAGIATGYANIAVQNKTTSITISATSPANNGAHTHTVTGKPGSTGPTPASTDHENMPPWVCVGAIIKALL